MESMVPVCDKRYHIYNRFRLFGAEIKKLWNYPLTLNDIPVPVLAMDTVRFGFKGCITNTAQIQILYYVFFSVYFS